MLDWAKPSLCAPLQSTVWSVEETLRLIPSLSGTALASICNLLQVTLSGPGAAAAQMDGLAAGTAGPPGQSTTSCLSAFSAPGQQIAHAPTGGPQTVLAGNIQSIETKIALKAMQRIAALFQHAQAPVDANQEASPGPIPPAPTSAFAVIPSASGSAFAPLPAAATQAPAGPMYAEPAGQQPKPSTGAAAPPSDGAFCGDSDVVGDVKVCDCQTPPFLTPDVTKFHEMPRKCARMRVVCRRQPVEVAQERRRPSARLVWIRGATVLLQHSTLPARVLGLMIQEARMRQSLMRGCQLHTRRIPTSGCSMVH